MVRVDHLEVAVEGHDGHEGDAGRTVERQHEEVYLAPGAAEHPVLLEH